MVADKLNIGVLALQGDVIEHISTLQKLNIDTTQVRLPEQLNQIDGLIIPGGESTTISNLLGQFNLRTSIISAAKKGMPIYGTCAGAIIVCSKIIGDKKVKPLRLIDIEVKRNAYGRQLDSFEAKLKLLGEKKEFEAAFIRAPVFSKIGKKATVLCMHEKKPVLVRQGNVLAGTFHTELFGETAIHKLFLEMVKK